MNKLFQFIPQIDREKERELVLDWQQNKNIDSRNILVESHLKFVVKIAYRYKGYKIPIDDLVSEGVFGLMKAIDRFDLNRGFKLVSFAIWWIRAEIMNYIIRTSSLFKYGTTQGSREFFYKFPKAKKKVESLYGINSYSDEFIEKISDELGMAKEAIWKLLNLKQKILSLNNKYCYDDEYIDMIDAKLPTPEEILVNRNEEYEIKAFFNNFEKKFLTTERERAILRERLLSDNPMTLVEIGKSYGNVSKERIRQNEQGILEMIEREARHEKIDKKFQEGYY